MKKVSLKYVLDSAMLLLYLFIFFANFSFGFLNQEKTNVHSSSFYFKNELHHQDAIESSNHLFVKNTVAEYVVLENEEYDDETNDSEENDFVLFQFVKENIYTHSGIFIPSKLKKNKINLDKPLLAERESLCVLFRVFRI